MCFLSIVVNVNVHCAKEGFALYYQQFISYKYVPNLLASAFLRHPQKESNTGTPVFDTQIRDRTVSIHC